MSILIDEKTPIIVQGMTGDKGKFHTKEMMDYGSNVVGGVTPGKGGTTHPPARVQHGEGGGEADGRHQLASPSWRRPSAPMPSWRRRTRASR